MFALTRRYGLMILSVWLCGLMLVGCSTRDGDERHTVYPNSGGIVNFLNTPASSYSILPKAPFDLMSIVLLPFAAIIDTITLPFDLGIIWRDNSNADKWIQAIDLGIKPNPPVPLTFRARMALKEASVSRKIPPSSLAILAECGYAPQIAGRADLTPDLITRIITWNPPFEPYGRPESGRPEDEFKGYYRSETVCALLKNDVFDNDGLIALLSMPPTQTSWDYYNPISDYLNGYVADKVNYKLSTRITQPLSPTVIKLAARNLSKIPRFISRSKELSPELIHILAGRLIDDMSNSKAKRYLSSFEDIARHPRLSAEDQKGILKYLENRRDVVYVLAENPNLIPEARACLIDLEPIRMANIKDLTQEEAQIILGKIPRNSWAYENLKKRFPALKDTIGTP